MYNRLTHIGGTRNKIVNTIKKVELKVTNILWRVSKSYCQKRNSNETKFMEQNTPLLSIDT